MKRPYKEEALRWLIQAKDEFEDAEELRKRGRFYLALFHFQQSAEKALKAYLYHKSKSIESFYTHSIDELINIISEVDPDFKKLILPKNLTDIISKPDILMDFQEEYHQDILMTLKKQKKQ